VPSRFHVDTRPGTLVSPWFIGKRPTGSTEGRLT
jgi:hypothetical protein